jgi:protein SCO1
MRRVLVAWLLALAALSAWAADPPRHGFAPPAALGGPIDLIDQHGAPFSLARVAGRPALVFFGFVGCSATCPIAMHHAQQILAAFGPGAAPSIVFVTLDPLTDTPRELAQHLAPIDSRLIGLTGDPLRIEHTAARYGVGVRHGDNGVEHSSMWYLLDPNGRLQRVYPYSTPVAELVADLRALQTPR